MIAVVVMIGGGAASAAAAASGPGWAISSVAKPTNFRASDTVIANEVQNIYVNATGGTFTLQYEGETTAPPINYNATATEVRTALEALPTIGSGNVEVTGGPTGEGDVSRWVVTFAKSVPNEAAVELEANGGGLSGGEHAAKATTVSGESTTHDSYTVTVTNTGGVPTSGTVTIRDALPPEVTASEQVRVMNVETHFPNFDQEGPSEQLEQGFTCTTGPVVQCEYGRPLPPGGELEMRIPVRVTPEASGEETNVATVEGGISSTSPFASTSRPATVANTLNGPPESLFGVQDFSAVAYGSDGVPDTRAGDHPNAFTASFDFTSVVRGANEYEPVEEPKEVKFDLPLGLVGDPQATPKCNETDLARPQGQTACPAASRVGTIDAKLEGSIHSSLHPVGPEGSLEKGDEISAIYNMVPEEGYPAVFGVNVSEFIVLMYAKVVHTPSGYDLQVRVPGISRVLTQFEGASVTFFGDPAEHDGGSTSPAAFFTNPVDCSAGPLAARIEADSWRHPERWVSKEAQVYPRITGCEMLQFSPLLAFRAETSATDTPSGYSLDLKVPQAPNVFPASATPEVKDVTVALPVGVSLSPSAAGGLAGCQAVGSEGIGIPEGVRTGNEFGEGEEIGADGLPRLAPGRCPQASQIGEVEIVTPLLPSPLHGHLFVAQPSCGGEGQPACTEASATNGELYGLYLEAQGQSEGHSDGVIIKLRGSVSANPTTGQLTATFKENPQLPFSELKVNLNGGERAPLANPQTCGTFTTTSDLTPWSAPVTPDATPTSSFPITGCASPMPFVPSFSAGVLTPSAAGSSPFTITFSRHDGEQDLSGISVTTPPGLVGMLSQVPLCEEAQANAGSCPEVSRIGTTTVAAGAGSQPLWIAGKVYLTGPYNGAPFGLSVVVPAKAGPFNLGNVVVRSAINIDPRTSAITVTSGPLPQIKDGVPFRLKTINVTIDRPGFMLNPTNCEQQGITATIAAAQGARASVSSPFAVAGCANLPFKPSFTVSTQAKTSKANGASLDVKVAYPASGQANIKSVKVDLPLQLPSRLTTLQKACTAAVFDSNPAMCPPESIVGIAKAKTPVLPVTLTGPAYLVSHANESFPNLVVILQGEGVRVDLTGDTRIRKGITSSTFASIPDVPVSSFELYLPQGHYSALTANGNLCKGKLAMPTKITGQNGAVIKQTTVIKVTGCPKAKKARKARKAKKARTGRKATRARANKERSA